jgi:ankyrin repeat protein
MSTIKLVLLCLSLPFIFIFVTLYGWLHYILQSVLLWAIRTNRLSGARFVLATGFNPNVSEEEDAPILLAVKHKNQAMIDLLLAHHANPDYGRWLSAAVQNSDTELAQDLLRCGAKPNQTVPLKNHPLLRLPPPKDYWLISHSYSVSLLYLAIEKRNYPLVQALLAHGANPAWGLNLITTNEDSPMAPHSQEQDSTCWDLAEAMGDEKIRAWLEEAKARPLRKGGG